MTDAAHSRRLRQLEDLCSASLRALAADPLLHWRGQRLWRGAMLMPRGGPHLEPGSEPLQEQAATAPADDELASFRGAADGLALRQRHSDAALHRARVPADDTARWVFELLEQLRCESLAELPGVRRNLRRRHEAWSLAFHRSGLTETDAGLLLYTLAQVARSRVCAEDVLPATEGLIESTRAAIVPILGPALAGLRRDRHDQSAYADHALALAAWVAEALAAEAQRRPGRRQAGTEDRERRQARFLLRTDFDVDDADALPTVGGSASKGSPGAGEPYRVYTRVHDREQRAAAGIRAALLDEYRERLDQRLAASGLNAQRLARELRGRLSRPETQGWSDGEEDGRIDPRRLAQLVATPAETRLFRRPCVEPVADAAIALLIDCSGSMRQQIEPLAMLVDLLARACEAAGAQVEVLGFTTAAWNGGQALRDWQRDGRPARPGRLAERCHWIFKDADTPWRRARRDIAALLKADRFREGLDGEAVDWACERLRARPVARRHLFVFSDGSPADSATGLANGHDYLDRHLQQVLLRRLTEGEVRITGVGIGLDLGRDYPHSVALDLGRGLGQADALEIVRTIRPWR
jgi:cobaltochelatase CobT